MKTLVLLIICYFFIMLSIISWGIPSEAHPFTYHMDEWHQLMAVKGVFTQGSPNIPGAAHGPMFQFILSGLFLGPFYILNIVDPFAIKSSISSLAEQGRLFEVLRLNTALFGIFSIIVLWKIAKDQFHLNPVLTTVLFTTTPMWIMLSNYFKYDIAMIFWMLTTFYLLFLYNKTKKKKIFYFAAVTTALALATKISVIPLVALYAAAYLFFTKKRELSLKDVGIGVGIFFIVFSVFGIPDLYLGIGDYYEYFYANLFLTPQTSDNIILDLPQLVYLPVKIYPLIFGHVFYVLSIVSLLYVLIMVIQKARRKELVFSSNEGFLLLSFFLFTVSLIPLKVSATGNRSLVLLPFLALFVGIVMQKLVNHLVGVKKSIVVSLLIIGILVQMPEVLLWTSLKWIVDPRVISSQWIKDNISSQMIGIENIPIYQYLPDVILKEYYLKQENQKARTQYDYAVIDEKARSLPNIIVMSNVKLESKYYKNSPKKRLLERLKKEKYREKKVFDIPFEYYQYFDTEREFYFTGLVPIAAISVFTRE